MKFLLVLVVVMVGVWMWRSGRMADKDNKQRHNGKPSSATPTDMVSCHQCSVHFPKDDGVMGRLGIYCCAKHRQLAEP